MEKESNMLKGSKAGVSVSDSKMDADKKQSVPGGGSQSESKPVGSPSFPTMGAKMDCKNDTKMMDAKKISSGEMFKTGVTK